MSRKRSGREDRSREDRSRKARGSATRSRPGAKPAPSGLSAKPRGQEPDRTGQDPRRHARPVITPDEPWIPSGRAHAEELGPDAPTVSRLAEIEDADAIAAGGVAAASESDAEAGVGAAPEHLAEEVLPEFGVDTTFSLDEATVFEEEEGLEDELESPGDRARDQSERHRPVR